VRYTSQKTTRSAVENARSQAEGDVERSEGTAALTWSSPPRVGVVDTIRHLTNRERICLSGTIAPTAIECEASLHNQLLLKPRLCHRGLLGLIQRSERLLQ